MFFLLASWALIFGVWAPSANDRPVLEPNRKETNDRPILEPNSNQ